ncbi:MAG: DNA mismatch repair endonuclease MutL [Phycisphaerales bacterium]|nr:DNA mismatch repair endonuclease MutL [Phycisphaerales bacterium]
MTPGAASPNSPPATRSAIRVLPALLVNQIAAGEVVERPASVVKELIDNAIDAGAARITVELEQGGIELVRVTDDGRGVPVAEARLMLAPHATSKIREATDLDQIATMGFRGEALASICSVSRLTVRSRSIEEPAGWLLSAEGDTIGEPRPEGAPVGTSLTVRNLFFNTPARRKFLRTAGTEQTNALDIVRDLAMAHPAIAFKAVCDGRTVIDVPPDQTPAQRLLNVLGRELAPQMLEVHADEFDDARGLALWGMIGLPTIARATAKAQRIFINGRPIRDKTIQHAVREAYRGLIEPGRYPTAALMLQMSPEGVDVNVHPTKSEVRFRDSSLVHRVVFRAIKEALQRADLTPDERWSRPGSSPGASLYGSGVMPAGGGAFADAAAPVETSADTARRFVDYFNRVSTAGRSSGNRFDYDALREAVERERASEQAPTAPAPPSSPAAPDALLPAARPAERILQVHNSYLVTQDEHGLVIVDQHALHERVMFEALSARLAQGPLESQRLLTPATLSAPPSQVEKLGDLSAVFARLGVEAAPLGPDAVAIHAFPTFLFDRGVDPAEFIAGILERAEEEGFGAGDEEALHEALDMMACKAAVKAGDRLSDEELQELMRLREAVDRSSNCPHGRPTAIRLSIRDLEKRFGRG